MPDRAADELVQLIDRPGSGFDGRSLRTDWGNIANYRVSGLELNPRGADVEQRLAAIEDACRRAAQAFSASDDPIEMAVVDPRNLPLHKTLFFAYRLAKRSAQALRQAAFYLDSPLAVNSPLARKRASMSTGSVTDGIGGAFGRGG